MKPTPWTLAFIFSGLMAPALVQADAAEVAFRRCLSHKRAGKLEAARSECEDAVSKRPTHAAAYYTLGTLQHAQRELGLALASFRKCRELEPRNGMGWAGEGAMLLRMKQYAEAEKALRRAVALDPKDAASVGNLGSALGKQKKTEEAISVYRQALERMPESVEVLNNLAVAFRAQRRNKEAIDALAKALKLSPADPALAGNMAKALRAEKRYGEATRYYESALKGAPRDPGLWFDLAYSYEQNGQAKQALAAYRKHLELIGPSAKGAENVRSRIAGLEGSL